MSRRKADAVDATFDLWREMTDEQRASFDQRVQGFWAAVRGFGLDGKAPTAPRTRQRKVKLDASQDALAAMRAERRAPIDATKPTPNTTFG